MLERFFKSADHAPTAPRGTRAPIVGNIYIKRKGRPTIRGSHGNISQGGMFLELPNMISNKVKRLKLFWSLKTV